MAEVSIRVRTKDEATRELKQINDTLQRMERDFKGVGSASKGASTNATSAARDIRSSWLSVGATIASVTAAVFAAKKVFDFAQEGAQLDRLAESGSEVARQMGGDLDLIEAKIQEASRNTISEFDAIRSANRAMMLGLTSDADQLANLVEVAAFRGRAMGISTQQAFEDIVTGIGRLSPLILDNLGIVIDAEKRYAEWADEMGVSKDQIDATTKRQILLNSVLEEGNRMLAEAGGLAEDNAESYERLSAAAKDLFDELKRGLGEALTPVASGFGDFLLATTAMRQAVDAGIISQSEANNTLALLVLGFTDATTVLKELNAELLAYNLMLQGGDEGKQLFLDGLKEIKEAVEEIDFTDQLKDLQLFLQDPLGDAVDQFNDKQDDLIRKAAEMRDQIAELEGLPLTERGQIELRNLRSEFDETKQAIIDNALAHEEATKRIIVDLLMQQAAVDGVTQAEYNLILQIMEAWGLVGQSTVEAAKVMSQALAIVETDSAAARDMILQIGQAAQMVEGDYFIRFNVQVNDPQGFLAEKGFGRRQSVDDLINERFAPGTFKGTRFFGGMTEKAKKVKDEIKKSAAEIALEMANVFANIGSMAARMLEENTVEPLKKQIEAIDKLISASHLDMTARERAAELEQQRAEAVAKVAEAEEKILAFQKAQQQLNFLEQQVELLNLIKEHKLSKDILDGLTLGLDADPGAVLSAMTKAINQLIQKTKDELGIASESKVFKNIGQEITGGMALGIRSDVSKVESARNELFGAVLPSGMPIGPMIDDRAPQQGGISNLTVQVIVPDISSNIDIEDMAFRVSEVIKRRLP